MSFASRGWRSAILGCAVALPSLLASPPLSAEPAVTPPPPAAAAQSDSQREAAAILKRMTEYLAALPAFSLNFREGYDVVQASGQKIEFGDKRSLVLVRPDRLRVEEIASDGRHDLALFDGKTVTVFDSDAQVYAQAPQPGALDDALVYFVRDLQMRMPLALLMTTRLPAELPGRVTAIDYVESTDLWGTPADHIAGRTASVDFQFWIAQGDHPWPLRVVISYRNEPGQPQFWANMADWTAAPAVQRSTFEFVPAKDARKIAFAVQAKRRPPAPATGMQP
ncbi:MAG TPA: DUF2092 domain-containing protein [Steroidobacteraceae bacterium]